MKDYCSQLKNYFSIKNTKPGAFSPKTTKKTKKINNIEKEIESKEEQDQKFVYMSKLVENAVIMKYSLMPSLIIDPQDQAKSWLVNMYPTILAEKHVYQMATFCGKRFESYCNSLLGMDYQIMIEGIENDVDTTLDPILEKQFVGKASNSKIKKIMINGQQVDFDERFKMFLLCKLINPHFTPELAAKTTIIDFCVTAIGLEQQLQAIAISKEQKTLEETLKNTLSENGTVTRGICVQDEQGYLSHIEETYNLDNLLKYPKALDAGLVDIILYVFETKILS